MLMHQMVQGAMELMWVFKIGTMYKLFEKTFNDHCNKYIIHKDRNEEDMTHVVLINKTMLWHQILGHTGEKGLRALHG